MMFEVWSKLRVLDTRLCWHVAIIAMEACYADVDVRVLAC